ncbi:LysR substrate-binding domain-containing protein [Microbacterium sp. 5K110]|uniref:LysR family transcriptional regulator n=1 Tax=unclassified Microbacterium TaxID=2609290 RepID=UPI0010FEED70|nr:LysR substrate-binding domain-containing protein [Microbacterium sp. 5K110]TLF31136.1 LysR family transcriptional regulator [Microbacterium sp. 5K110]
MDVDSLRFVVTLAEERHFGRSAHRHHIGAAQFGRRIRQIEIDLGVEIFHRTSRRVEVTAVGEAVLAQTERVLDELDRLRSSTRQAEAENTVRVGVLGFGVGDRWSHVRDLVLAWYPGVTLAHRTLTLVDQYSALRRREVDVALVHYLGDVEGLDLQLVMQTPRVAVIPASSPLAASPRISAEDIDHHRWLRFAEGDERFSDWVGPYRPDTGGTAIATLDTVTTAVATTGLFGIHGEVAARFFARPDVRFLSLDGAPVSTALATRDDDDRPVVGAFRAAAAFVADLSG